MLALLGEPLGAFHHQLGEPRMFGGVAIAAAGDDFPLDGAAHLGDFLRAFVDKQHDDLHFGMVLGNRLGEMLQQYRLASPRRRHDQATLPFADRREQIHHARRQRLLAELQLNALMWIDRRHLVEVALHELVGRQPLDGRDIFEARPAAALPWFGRAGNLQARA